MLFTYIVNCFTLNFTDIIWSWGGLLDHLHGDWGKDSVLASLTSEVSTLGLVTTVEATIASVSSEVVTSAEAAVATSEATIVSG